jgi:hypothetical protein
VISAWRSRFNAQFTEEKYAAFVAALENVAESRIDFRPCETPVFLPRELLDEMVESGGEILAQLNTPQYHLASSRAVPDAFRAPNEGTHPDFIQVDFAVTRDTDGKLAPKADRIAGLRLALWVSVDLAECVSALL